MRWTILAPAASLGVLLAAPASASLSDFRLPADPAVRPEPDRQGPVAPDVPESRRPAPTPTPTSRAPAPTPAPTATAPRIVLPDLSDEAPAAQPSRTTRDPAATARPSAPDAAAVAADASGTDAATEGLGLSDAGPAPIAASPFPASTSAATTETVGSSLWLWALAALAALGALGFAGWIGWKRRPVSRPAAVPQVERPRLVSATAPAADDTALPEPLQVALEPLRLSLTLVNATLAYRLEIANRGAAPIAGLAIGADMISAHASMTREQQLSGPGAGAATLQRIERLDPGESRIVEGEFRLPFPQIVPIRQGNAALLLPLARFRVEAEGAQPLVRTFVVGQPGQGSSLQPFRLDQGPRVYPRLAQHAFA